ncbi:hypothetical protein AGMMS49525_13020 [Bacteroidia bacterium]|nr:hypothetical protein AGMMS49525_13020 [Bacteroidia bacterium]
MSSLRDGAQGKFARLAKYSTSKKDLAKNKMFFDHITNMKAYCGYEKSGKNIPYLLGINMAVSRNV